MPSDSSLGAEGLQLQVCRVRRHSQYTNSVRVSEPALPALDRNDCCTGLDNLEVER